MKGKRQRGAAQRAQAGDDDFSLQAQEKPEVVVSGTKAKARAKPPADKRHQMQEFECVIARHIRNVFSDK